MNRHMRQGQQPFDTRVRPTGGRNGAVFVEEWESSKASPGGSYAALNGMAGLPARWAHVMPAGDSGASAVPVISLVQQMLWLALPAQPEGDAVQFRWNSALARLPTPPAGNYAYQLDACFRIGLTTPIDPAPATPKPPKLGVVIGTDAMLAAGWLAPFFFAGAEIGTDGSGEVETSVWTNAQTLSAASANDMDALSLYFVSILIDHVGANTTYTTWGSSDGVSKILISSQTINNNQPTVIGFAVQTEEPAPDDLGQACSGWFEYMRVRDAATGEIGTGPFGQVGGRNW